MLRYFLSRLVFKYIAYFSCFLALSLLTFNIYYFFVRRDVSIKFYIDKLFQRGKDAVLTSPEFHDLVAQYYQFNKAYGNREVIVFLGDSLTKGFNLQEHFPDRFILNRGINSDTTVSLLDRLDRNVGNLRIEKIFVLIGFNDLKYRNDSEIIANIRLILDRIKARQVYVQSLLPVDAEKKELNKRITNVNEMLRILCSDKGVEYIDLHMHFVDKVGGLSKNLSLDGAHINAEGYRLWRELIAAKI